MELLSFQYQDHLIAVVLDTELQLERLMVDGSVMSVKPIQHLSKHHSWEDPQAGQFDLQLIIDPQAASLNYQLSLNGSVVVNQTAPLSEEISAALLVNSEQELVVSKPTQGKSWLVIGSIALKLFKTVKVAKVALAGASVAVYSVMFTFEFALALIAVLVFHEYGHLRAMKKFGIPTKGMYLIPFVGGIAVGDQPRTQWEEVYIAMMGPVFGLIMTAVFYGVFLVTGSHFCGLVTSVSAFLNLVNLLPVYPLDGGRVIKALVFSRRNRFALVLLLTLSAVCLYISYASGLVFLSFFILVGVVDLISSWSVPLAEDITPLKTYGIWFSFAWYLAVSLAFIAMIVLIAEAKVPGSEIVIKILQS